MKKETSVLRRIFRLGDWQAILIILTSGLLDAYVFTKSDSAASLALIAYLYSAYGFVVLIVKLREWLGRLNRRLRRRFERYDLFCRRHAESLNSRGKVAKTIYVALRVLTVVSAVEMLVQGEIINFLMCVLTLLLFTLPDFIRRRFSVHLPTTLETIIYCFIFAAEILGEINNFFGRIPGWDTMLHTLNGFLCAAIGFSLVDLLNRQSQKNHLSPAYLAFMAFCFSMTVSVVWEFIEFFADHVFAADMQKDTLVRTVRSIFINPAGANVPILLRDIQETVILYGDGESFVIQGGYLDIGLIDTMKDLLVNFIGAVVFCLFGYSYVKNRDTGHGHFAEKFIPVVETTRDENDRTVDEGPRERT